MTPTLNLTMDLMDLSADLRWLAHRLKNHGKTSEFYPGLFQQIANTVDQVAKEVAAS